MVKHFTVITGALFVLATASVQAARVDVRPTPVAGISIVSAELAEDLESSADLLVVRLRNDSATADQAVGVAATIRDAGGAAAGGFVSGGCMNGIKIEAPPGGEKVVSLQIDTPLDTEDTVAVELVDINNFASAPDNCYYCQGCVLRGLNTCRFGVKSYSCDCDDESCSFTCMTCEEAGQC